MRLAGCHWIKENHRFRRLYRRGRFHNTPAITLYYRQHQRGKPQLAVAVSRKLGGAVQRNFAKRRLRHLLRDLAPELRAGTELILMARAEILTRPFASCQTELREALRRLELLRPEPAAADSESPCPRK